MQRLAAAGDGVDDELPAFTAVLFGRALTRYAFLTVVKRRVKSVGRTETLADRLARLTFLCSEIQDAAKGQRVPTDRLQATLSEAEELCRALRKEIKRRSAEDAE